MGTGALPLWTDFAKSIIRTKKYKDKADFFDIQMLSKNEWPLSFGKKTTPYLIDMPRGLILRAGKDADIEIWQTTNFTTTGEKYLNPFAINRHINSLVYLPQTNYTESWTPYRAFSPVEFLSSLSIEKEKGPSL